MTFFAVALLVSLAIGNDFNTDIAYSRLLSAAKCLTPSATLALHENRFGIRGIHVKSSANPIRNGDVLLSVPLSSCLQDLGKRKSNEVEDQSFTLAKEFIRSKDKKLLDAWSALFPDPNELRESLPLHWDDAALQATGLRSFQDQAIKDRDNQEQRISRLKESGVYTDCSCSNFSSLSLGDILDLCNTRECRVENSDVNGYILAPAFDMINHAPHGYNNASYKLEKKGDEYYLVVRSKRELGANEEILIDYGEDTRDLDCLHNYGFLPRDIQAGAEIMSEGKPHLINLRRGKYGIGVELVKAASDAVGNQNTESLELGELEAEWIVGQLDKAIVKNNKSVEAENTGITGMETAKVVRKMVSSNILLQCRERLISDKIKNPLRKMSLMLSKPKIT